MSVLASVYRRIPAPSRPLQPRRYAGTHKITKKSPESKQPSQSFKGKGRVELTPLRRDKHPGAFRPLPTGQLTHQLFQTSEAEELDLATFNEVKKKKPGVVLQFSMSEKDAIRIWGVPKNLLVEFRILSKPCSVIRDVTISALDMLLNASQQSSSESRFVISGRPGCGKSFLLLQTVEYCASRDWIVMYIPRAINLVNSTTTYAYDLRTQTYFQPSFASQTLQRVLKANTAALNSLHMRQDLSLEKKTPVPAGTPLADLINIGLKEPPISPIILDRLVEELGKQNKYPVLLAVDDFQALYCKTAYMDAHFVSISPYHLSMPRLIMEYASGKRSFARGAVLGAISTSHPEFRLPIELREELGLEYDQMTGPYTKRSSRLMEYAKGLRAFPVPEKLTVEEAAALFEVWAKDRALHSLSNDELFLSKYTEASGNARDFVWKGLLSTLGS